MSAEAGLVEEMVTLKNKIRQHVPAFFEGFEPETVEFETVEQLLDIPWVHHFTEHPEFYRFSLHRDCRTLMAEYKDGAYWLVVGFIMHPMWHVSPEKLPRWEPKF